MSEKDNAFAGQQCSFCSGEASTCRSDEIYPCCEYCGAAWDENPGFLSEEEMKEVVERINANPYLSPEPHRPPLPESSRQ